MKQAQRFFTSESVTEGHPDKVADQISDAILDALLQQDPDSRVACETLVLTGMIHVCGQISTNSYVDMNKVIRQTIKKIGYLDATAGMDAETCGVCLSIDEQSPDIAMGVDKALEAKQGEMPTDAVESVGAGDQGMMFGYACKETPELMPLPITLAHRLVQMLSANRKNNSLPYLRPDGKSQVTIQYDGDKPVRAEAIVLSAQHQPDIPLDVIRQDIIERVIGLVIPENFIDKKTKIYVNPTGRFVIGGPLSDAGLTGRKIIVDTYGGMARHGGGAFSGKDPTKVDRSASYMARYVAKNVVAAGLADRCEVAISYAIGVAHPMHVAVETFGTEKIDPEKIAKLVKDHFDMRPGAIIRDLKLKRPIYLPTAAYGHFGRPELDLPWEKIDKAETLRKAAGITEHLAVVK